MQNVFVVIPCYNEAAVLAEVLSHVTTYVPATAVIVVNDGSTDDSGIIAHAAGVHVAEHRINRGLGAALKTGMDLALVLGAHTIVTFDADGQHHGADIARLVAAIEDGAGMVIGSRNLDRQQMPWYRRVYNNLGNAVTWGVHGVWVSDSQSGLRAFRRVAIEQMRIRSNRMEVSSELVKEAHRLRLPIVEIPVRPMYSAYSLSKGQSFLGGVRTLITMAIRLNMD
jgi:UDP-N-acetylglucosamine---dolichyl-phosphate N-acetylglucosaminyltransferase